MSNGLCYSRVSQHGVGDLSQIIPPPILPRMGERGTDKCFVEVSLEWDQRNISLAYTYNF